MSFLSNSSAVSFCVSELTNQNGRILCSVQLIDCCQIVTKDADASFFRLQPVLNHACPFFADFLVVENYKFYVFLKAVSTALPSDVQPSQANVKDDIYDLV